LFATPPVFRPLHVEYAVEKGVHVFMEKSFAVDAPGIRRMLENEKKATAKNLKVVGRMTVFSGQKISWDDAIKSDVELCPNIDTMTWGHSRSGAAGRKRPIPANKTRRN
jgi:hypothetical protein